MNKLNETQRLDILIIIRCGNRNWIYNELCTIFNTKYADTQKSQANVSRVERNFK